MSATYDVVVLGAGSAGTNVAWYARDNGLSVAIVEPELVGGECSYWACIPSKALLGPPRAVAAARRIPGAAQAVSGSVDVDAVLRRRDALISDLDDRGVADWVSDIGATLVRGTGRLVGEREVEVALAGGGTRRLRAERAVVVATGSRAAAPPVEGLDDVDAWTNRSATTTDTVPERLAVIGGGPVGCEMAQAFRRLGAADVCIIEMSDRILAPYDPWVSELVTDAFEDEGIRILAGRSVEHVTRDDGTITLTLDNGDEFLADEMLVAAGRTHNTDDIGLENLGLEPGGPLEVDDHLRVSGHDWLYAAGDVNGRALLTHQGKYQARILGDVLAGRDVAARSDHGAVPQALFTDPEVASVGATAADAADGDTEVKVVTHDLGATAGAALVGGSGRAQLVIDERRRVVIGATFVGPHVSELLHAATIAIVAEVRIDTLWHAVPAFPTISEVWLRLLEEDRDLI